MDLVEAQARGFNAGTRHPWERARLDLVTWLIARDAPLAPGDSVIDVGCGDTFVVEQLASRYPDVQFHAVDSAFTPKLMADFAARLRVPNVSLARSLDEVSLPRAAALVLLMDVIEHVPDDRGFLNGIRARALTGPLTRFLITVPSYNWLFCSHDRFLGHYRRYSRRTLRNLLNDVSLVPIEDGHLFASLLPLRAIQVLRERLWKPGPPSTDLATWNGNELAGRTLATLLSLDGRVGIVLARAGIRIPGLSNFAVCRPSA